MSITAGTWPGYPIDLGITEKANSLLGGALNTFGNTFVNPNQAPSIGPQSGSIQPGMTVDQANAALSGGSQNPPPPTVKQQTQAPAPTGSFNSDIYNRYYQGWDYNTAAADWAATGGSKANQGGSGGIDIGGMIQSMYDPAIQSLQGYQDWATQNQANQLSQAGMLKSQSQSALDQLINSGKLSFDTQTNTLQQSQQKGEDKNARDYRNALQRYQSQFGQGASTGAALSEVILGEFLRAGGDLQQSYANGMQALLGAKRNWEMDIQNKETQIQNDYTTNIQNINSDFNKTMADIAARRGELESAKTAARIDALQTAVANAQQQTQVRLSRLADLQNLKAQYQLNINNSGQYLDQLISSVAADISNRNLQGGQFDLGQSTTSSPIQSNSIYRTQQDGKWRDPYTGLLY